MHDVFFFFVGGRVRTCSCREAPAHAGTSFGLFVLISASVLAGPVSEVAVRLHLNFGNERVTRAFVFRSSRLLFLYDDRLRRLEH